MNGTVDRTYTDELDDLLDELERTIAAIRHLADQMKEQSNDE